MNKLRSFTTSGGSLSLGETFTVTTNMTWSKLKGEKKGGGWRNKTKSKRQKNDAQNVLVYLNLLVISTFHYFHPYLQYCVELAFKKDPRIKRYEEMKEEEKKRKKNAKRDEKRKAQEAVPSSNTIVAPLV